MVGQFDYYARVVRPWRQFLDQPFRNWKSPLRLARNAWWSRRPLSVASPEWSSRPVRAFEESHRSAVERQPVGTFTPCRRAIATLNYFLACPCAEMSAHVLLRGEELRGYFLLAQFGGQTRIVDLWVQSEEAAQWSAAFSLAAKAAAALPRTCEIMTATSVDGIRSALERNGFVRRSSDPIFLCDPDGRLNVAPPLHLNLVDGDHFFLHDPGWPYLT